MLTTVLIISVQELLKNSICANIVIVENTLGRNVPRLVVET